MLRLILIFVLLTNNSVFGLDIQITKQNNTRPTKIEKLVIDNVNDYRADLGLSKLKTHPNLVQAARDYAKTMAENNFFAHDDLITPFNKRPEMRIYRTGFFGPRKIGENLFRCDGGFEKYSLKKQAQMAVQAWHDSKTGHREAMQDKVWNYTGVGAYTLNGQTYFVQLFAYIPYEIKDIKITETANEYVISGFIEQVDNNYNETLKLYDSNLDVVKQVNLNSTFTVVYKKNSGRHILNIGDDEMYFKALFLDTDENLENVISLVAEESNVENGTWVQNAEPLPTQKVVKTNTVYKNTSSKGIESDKKVTVENFTFQLGATTVNVR